MITVKNIKDSIVNTAGIGVSGYNGEFTITSIPNSLKFEYSTGNKTIGDFGANNFDVRSLDYPRFERTDLKSNIYVFRNNIVSEYINDMKTPSIVIKASQKKIEYSLKVLILKYFI